MCLGSLAFGVPICSLEVNSFRDAAMVLVELSHWQPERPTSDALQPQSRAKHTPGRAAYSMMQLYHMLSMSLVYGDCCQNA